jgi:hypothetical protein
MIWKKKRFWRILLIYAGWVTDANLLLYVLVSESCNTLSAQPSDLQTIHESGTD